MSYAKVEEIRVEAGFGDNANIGNDKLEGYQTEAQAQINSIVGGRYDLTKLVDTNQDFYDDESTPKVSSGARDLLRLMEKLLVAGMAQNTEYPGEETVDTSNGNVKIERVENMLTQIADGMLYLVKIDGTEFELRDQNFPGGKAVLVEQDFDCNDFKPSDIW